MIEIRRLGPDDVEHFKSIRLEGLREEPLAFSSTIEEWLALPEAEWLRRAAANPVFVAFDHSEAVGVMGLLTDAASKRKHRATLVMVYLRQSYRGARLAERLLDAVIDFAKTEGISQIELHVNAENQPAIRFYERRGFEPFGRLPNAVMSDGVLHDDLLMARQI